MALAALAAAAALGADIGGIQSSATQNWNSLAPLSWGADFVSAVDVTVDRTATHQEIIGFGGALTDTTAWNIMVGMNDTTRQLFLDSYYDSEKGLGYHIVRITLNSADYSVESFNYDNVTGDFALANFDTSLAYDQQRVIPSIKLANATAVANGNGPLKLFSSPWSPPGWMKTNNNMINSADPCLKNTTSSGNYQQVWADYYVKWLQSMRTAGIEFWGMTPQNEPLAMQHSFESCYWEGPAMRDWLRTYLGPAVKAQFPNIHLMLYDHNKIASYDWSLPTLNDPEAMAFVDGIAFHWYDYFSDLGLNNVDAIWRYPTMQTPGPLGPRFMLNTEACDLSNLYTSWSRGELLGVDMMGDLAFGVGGYVEWNHVLYGGYPAWRSGGPNHDNTTNFGDTSVLYVDEDGNQSLELQSWYWIMGHVSRFARPGSVRVSSSGQGVAASFDDYNQVRAYAQGQRPSKDAGLPLITFASVSPDGSTASVVIMNPSGAEVVFKLADNGNGGTVRAVNTTIPAHSIQTYTYAV